MAGNGGRINFQVGFNVDKSGLNQLKSSLQEIQKIKPGDFNLATKELREVQKTAKKVQEALTQAFNVNLGSLNINQFNQLLRKSSLTVNTVYRDFSKLGAQGQIAFNQMSTSLLTTNLQLKQTNSLVSKMGTTMMNTLKWTFSSSLIQQFTNGIRQAFQYVEALDASLTDIRIVTGDSTEHMRQFAQQANKAAQALGRSTMDYTKAALTFYQQGLDDQSVAARTQATLQAQNITGAGEEMANYLTAVWNGYKVANEQAQLYVDRLAAVADSSASNMAQLATAMSKVAATANAMGVDVDQLNAQIATIIATTRQAPQTVGNALKTIFARINDIQAGTQDAEVSLGHYTGAMAELGINVLDTSGHLRDTGQVMEEIGQKWQTMSREQQIYLARTMAGQRQYNNLIALFDNWGRYTELVNVSMDSQGTLMEKNSRYMDSLGAKMQQLGAAGEKVKDAIMNEEDMKGMVGFAAGAVNVFGNFIESIGGARGALLGLASIMTSVFSGVISKEINSAVSYFQNLRSNLQIIQNDINQTFIMAASQGYDKGTIKEIVDAKMQLASIYGVMSNEQINNYNNLVKQLGQEKNRKIALDDSVSSAKELEQCFKNIANGRGLEVVAEESAGALDLLGDSLRDIKNSESDLNFEGLKNKVQGVIKTMGVEGTAAVERFNEKLKNIQQIQNAEYQMKSLTRAAQDLYNALSNQYDNYASLQTLEFKAQSARITVENLQKQLKSIAQGKQQLFDIQNAVNFVGAIGRVSSGITSLVNLTRIWKNENLSTGQKVLQTFTNLGFTIPMIFSAMNSLKKVFMQTSTARQLLLNRELAQAKAQLAKYDEQIAKERALEAATVHRIEAEAAARSAAAKQGAATKNARKAKKTLEEVEKTGTKEQYKDAKANLEQAQTAQVAAKAKNDQAQAEKRAAIAAEGAAQAENDDAKANLLEGASAEKTAGDNEILSLSLKQVAASAWKAIAPLLPFIAIAGAAVAAGVALYMVYTKSSRQAEKAAAAAQKANERYKELKQTYDSLKQSLQDYSEAQNALDELTRGTQEWRDALLQANEAVLQLLNTYPQLAQYVTNQNGRLVISEEGQQAALDAQYQQVTAAQRAAAALAVESRQASIINQAVQLSRQVSGSDYNKDTIIDLATQVARTGIPINYDNYAETSWVQQLRGKALGEFNQLVNAIRENTEATKTTAQALVDNAWSDNAVYEGFTEAGQEVATAIGSAAYQANRQAIYEQLHNPSGAWVGITRATTADTQLNNQGETLQDWLTQYNQAMGTNATFSSNAVVKDDETGLLMINLLDESGQAFQITRQQMQMTIATARAMQQVEGVTLQTIREVNTALQQSNIGDAIGEWIAGGDLGSLTQAELQQIDTKHYFENLNLSDQALNVIATALETTVDKLPSVLGQIVHSTLNSIDTLVNNQNPIVQRVFRNIDHLSDLTISQQKEIVNNLRQAFLANDGSFGELENLYNSLGDQLDDFAQVSSEFDFSTGTVEDFVNQLQAAGIQTGGMNEALQAYIQLMKEAAEVTTPEQNYSRLTEIWDNLQNGGTISEEDKNYLIQVGAIARDQIYSILRATADGTWALIDGASTHLRTSLEEAVIEPFSTRYEETLQRYANLQAAAEAGQEGLSSDFYTVQHSGQHASAYIVVDNQGFANAIDFLRTLADTDDHAAELVAEYDQTIRRGEQFSSTLVRSAAQMVEQFAQSPGAIQDTLEQTADQIAYLESQIMDVGHDLDVDVSHVFEQARELAENPLSFEGVSQQLQGDLFFANQISQAIDRAQAAYTRMLESGDQWYQTLASGVQTEIDDIRENIRNTYADLLDLSDNGLYLDDSFLENINNFELLQQAINGDIEAYNELAMLAGQQYILSVNPEIDQQSLATFTDQYYGILNSLDDIAIGAYIDNQGLIQSINQMISSLGIGAAEAEQLLMDAFGIDATVVEGESTNTGVSQAVSLVPKTETTYVPGPMLAGVMGIGATEIPVTRIEYDAVPVTSTTTNKFPATSLRITNARRSAGGNIKYQQAPHGAGRAGQTARRPSGGGGGGKSSGSTAKPSVQKPSQDQRDPYHDINRLLDKQEQKLKNIQKQDKKLVNRDRLNNINAQNKALEEQANLLENKLAIAESQEIRLRNQLLADTNGYAQFGANGQITNFNQMLANAEKQYNDYIAYYNTLSKQQQDAEKDRLDLEKERYQRVKKTADEYEKTLDLQRDLLEQINEAQEKIYQNMIKQSQIRVDLAVDTGDLEREYLDFENKFIKKLDKDDFLGNAKANVKELMSYFNSDQIKKRNEEINSLNATIQRIEKNGGGAYVDPQTGYNLAAAQERLNELFKDQTKALQEIDSLVEDIQKQYLDSLKDAKDKMDDQIDQYERINDLLDHGAKLAQLIYGDKAYASLEKYYNLQQDNDERALNNLRMQQQYWQSQLNNEVVGSDAWLQIKKNLDDITDDINNKLQDIIDRLADQWEARVKKITNQMENGLTGGRGLSYLDEQWDYVNQYDDNFLDTLESKFGIQQVQTLYQEALDSVSGDPKSQQKINDLMQKQLKLLREKDKLTQYDIERAKAALEVEKARLALENQRDNKSKMRLRRDSQGNYTYQYVADEQKLSDLQAALNDAQANLYNMDKEHYKENLDEFYGAFKDYKEKMVALAQQLRQANAAGDKEEEERIKARMALLDESFTNFFDGLTEDNRYSLQYLAESFGDGMGFDKETQQAEGFFDIMKENIPQVALDIQNLIDNISSQGGIMSAMQEFREGLQASNTQYFADLNKYMTEAGTSAQTVMQVTDDYGRALDTAVEKAKQFLPYYDQMIVDSIDAIEGIRDVIEQIEELLDEKLDDNELVKSLRETFNQLEALNRYFNPKTKERSGKVTAQNLDVVERDIDTTEKGAGIITAQDWRNYLNNQQTSQNITLASINAIGQLDADTLNSLSNEDVLLNVIGTIKYLTDSMGAIVNQQIGSMIKEASSYIGNIENVEKLDQNVHIEANFPNVIQAEEIKAAFNNLVNMAAQTAYKPNTM